MQRGSSPSGRHLLAVVAVAGMQPAYALTHPSVQKPSGQADGGKAEDYVRKPVGGGGGSLTSRGGGIG